MQIHIFENRIKKAEPRWKIVLPTKYYRKHYTLDIICILSYVRFVQVCTYKFPMNA